MDDRDDKIAKLWMLLIVVEKYDKIDGGSILAVC